LIGYPALLISDYDQALRTEIMNELEREARILRTANQEVWFERAQDAITTLGQIDRYFWQAESVGIAKAGLFETLSEWADENDLVNPQIRLEDAYGVEGHKDLYRISGQIDVAFEPANNLAFLRQIESNDSKIVVERMEISQRIRPVHKIMIAAYFKVETE
jgi:hypothetical protein